MNTILNTQRVDEVYAAVVEGSAPVDLTPHDHANGFLEVPAGIDPARLEEMRPAIKEMLDELPPTFHEGWSFLNLVVDKHGAQWTDYHASADKLMRLGLACGWVKLCLPREFWDALPGGMPYVVVNTDWS